MIIQVGDLVKFSEKGTRLVGKVTTASDGMLIVQEEDTNNRYCVFEEDAELILGKNEELQPSIAEHHDEHYAELKTQPMDAITEWPVEQQIGFMRGNILKYTMRLGHKDKALQEARKVLRYAQWLVDVLEGKTINPRE